MLITILLFCSHIGVYGQIPDEVKDMWIACKKKMNNPAGSYHVITLSKPKSKDDPKKITIKIDKEKSLLREMSYKESGARITMTITRITFGVNDNIFMLDTSKYPGAIIVRK